MDSALLAQIQNGRKLKKTETNDRSAPSVSASKPSGGGMSSMGRPPVPAMAPPAMKAQPPSLPHTMSAPSAAPPVAPTGPQLGGLFSNGMPTLRKTKGAAVNTGRGSAGTSPTAFPKHNSPVPPPPPPPSTPSVPVAKPLVPTHTLPRNFKMPPVPGRSLPTPTPPIIASAVPPKTQAAFAPPAPPPPPPMASGVSPKIQAALIPPVPGRSRSNSSPQRPVPPPPPRMAPSPPTSPSVPRSQLAVPPLPPGRPRASSASAKPRSPRPAPPLTEGGRYTFRSLSDLPPPRSCSKSPHIYPSGESKGNAFPIVYDSIY